MSAKSDGPPLAPPPGVPDPPLALDAVFYTNAFLTTPLIRPNDGTPVIGIIADPSVSHSIIGIAFPYSHIGGMTEATQDHDILDAPPPEVVWRLVLDRAWVDGETVRLADKRTLDGRFVLRMGRFWELAEDAV